MKSAERTKPPKHGDHTVLWWVGWITLTIVTFFVSSGFWTPIIAKHFGSMDRALAPAVWVTAVFGTWMVLLVPLIIVMYNKVDRAYEEARIHKEKDMKDKLKRFSPVKFVNIPEAERLLSRELSDKINKIPETVKKGHLVTAHLKNGKKIEHVFVYQKTDVLGVYGHTVPPFKISEIVDITPSDLDHLPPFEAEGWLRFDGEEQG